MRSLSSAYGYSGKFLRNKFLSLLNFLVMVFMFSVELEKPSFCDLKVVNNTEHHVAFKVCKVSVHSRIYGYVYSWSILRLFMFV